MLLVGCERRHEMNGMCEWCASVGEQLQIQWVGQCDGASWLIFPCLTFLRIAQHHHIHNYTRSTQFRVNVQTFHSVFRRFALWYSFRSHVSPGYVSTFLSLPYRVMNQVTLEPRVSCAARPVSYGLRALAWVQWFRGCLQAQCAILR